MQTLIKQTLPSVCFKLYMQEKGNSGSNGYNEEYSIKELNRDKKTI